MGSGEYCYSAVKTCSVSIQLVSPTSGETIVNLSSKFNHISRFHSISFPNEWGVKSLSSSTTTRCFHSISFPNEWGGVLYLWQSDFSVSIQLVSPTSGEQIKRSFRTFWKSFHSISFPNEWGVLASTKFLAKLKQIRFHSISFPNEWGGYIGA